MMKLASAGAAVLALTVASAAGAEDSKSLLESVNIGDAWYGPKLTKEDLKGRVVLIEYWGRN